MSDFESTKLSDHKCVLFQTTEFVVICHNSNGKQTLLKSCHWETGSGVYPLTLILQWLRVAPR